MAIAKASHNLLPLLSHVVQGFGVSFLHLFKLSIMLRLDTLQLLAHLIFLLALLRLHTCELLLVKVLHLLKLELPCFDCVTRLRECGFVYCELTCMLLTLCRQLLVIFDLQLLRLSLRCALRHCAREEQLVLLVELDYHVVQRPHLQAKTLVFICQV